MNRGVLLAGLAITVFASQAIWVTYAPVTSLVAGELGVSKEDVGLLAIVYPVFFLVLTLPSGILLDRRFRLWLTVGVVTTGVAGVLRLLQPLSYPWLLGCQVLAAFGQPFLLNAFAPFASRVYPEARDRVVALLSFSMYLGIIYALGTGYWVYTTYGVMGLTVPVAIVSFIGMAVYMLGLRALSSSGGASSSGSVGVLGELRGLVRRRDLWVLGVLLGLGVALFDNMSIWLEAALAPAGLSDVAGVSVALALLLGLGGVTFIPERVARRAARTLYIRVVTITVTVFYAILAIAPQRLLVLSLIPAAGLLMLPAYPVVMEWISRFYERGVQGAASGLIGLISRVFTVTLAWAAIFFLSSPSSYFSFLALLSLTAIVFAYMLPGDR